MTAAIDDSWPGTGGREDWPTTLTLGSLLDGPEAHRVWAAAAVLLQSLAREALCDTDTAMHAPQRLTHHAVNTALTHGETRVLHYLPTNLSAREIAGELHLSVNTIKTHQRHLYQKLGVGSRSQAVERARALGLLAPLSRKR